MVGWDAISQYVKDAAVSTEDPRFYTHNGVDVLGLGRAVLGQLKGSDAGGASTITMQYVRNVLVQRTVKGSVFLSDFGDRVAATAGRFDTV